MVNSVATCLARRVSRLHTSTGRSTHDILEGKKRVDGLVSLECIVVACVYIVLELVPCFLLR
jgi:hypothetical protein